MPRRLLKDIKVFLKDRMIQVIEQSSTYQWLTPLKIPMGEPFHAIKDRGLLCRPAPIAKAPNKRDRSIFCDFHNTHGYTIVQCQDLRNQIEDLVRNRYLDDFIEGPYLITNSQHELKKNTEDVSVSSQLSGL